MPNELRLSSTRAGGVVLVGDTVVVDDAIDDGAMGVGQAPATRETSKAPTIVSENFIV